jgi:hypothetical protein
MERGSSKHGPMHDEALERDLQGVLGQADGHREEWLDPEPDDTDENTDENAVDGPAAARPEA